MKLPVAVHWIGRYSPRKRTNPTFRPMPETVLLELPYLPPVSWCALLWQAEAVTLEACENFQKGSYRNRCHIIGPNGLQRLTVPLAKGKHQQTPIREVRISHDENWPLVHWRSIEAAYGRSPFFEHYGPELRLFYEKKWDLLFDFNLALLRFLLKKMGWPGQITLSETYLKRSQPPAPGDFRDAVSPKNEAAPAWFRPVRYPQVFAERHGFVPDLSVLDLLFCCGKQSGEWLMDGGRLAAGGGRQNPSG